MEKEFTSITDDNGLLVLLLVWGFQINPAGYNQGKVGMGITLVSSLGTLIRPTCANEEDAKDAYVMPCALPINDVYGTEEQMYKEPDCLYQGSRVGAPTGVTSKCEKYSEEELAALFTFFDWCYTEEGGLVGNYGLNEEQVNSMKFDPDVYAENDVKSVYSKTTREDGVNEYKLLIDTTGDLGNAVKSCRLSIGYGMSGNEEWGYTFDRGLNMINQKAIDLWAKYTSTGSAMDYPRLFSVKEAEMNNKFNAVSNDYLPTKLPGLIMNGLDGWDDYCKGIEDLKADELLKIYNKYAASIK